MVALAPNQANAQELEHAFRQPWSLFVFVSTTMPRGALVSIARDAAAARATLVLRGFPDGRMDLGAEQRFVAALNDECCGVDVAAAARTRVVQAPAAESVPGWSIDPALYQKYAVTAVPTFVLAATGGEGERAFTKIAGDMALASALKYFAQGSSAPERRTAAASIYQTAFGGRQ